MADELNINLPDRVVTFTDNVDAKTFLLAIGILDKLLNPAPIASAETVMCAHFTHPTHWVLGVRIHGNRDENENGFLATAWPKSKFPKSVIQAAIENQGLGSPEAHKSFHTGEDTNSLS